MSVGKKLDKLQETVARIDERTILMQKDIDSLKTLFRKSDFNPLWLKVMIAINGVIGLWLSALTWLVVKNSGKFYP